ncbi:hypothetical protein QO010_000692 [Caulobacter ginsengisoli]|uniref:NACHT domain-containing protein n=1 Tax=Caulobacter ginsengisoli TaxID=400775 RepID=A0ABU0IPK1_9CAUL|nr:NACHT domain-containing protein [Caulobacter ginsengisoli]MDQ0462944.1 hypothetical protein [Caulobacter ginsengisoli]
MTTFDLDNPEPNSGDALRDEAANLLATRFGRPKREKRADGKKVDLYFMRRDFGRDVGMYVEAKDYNRNLSRAEVVSIWTDYSGIIRKNAPATLLVVTRNGLATDAQEFIETEQTEIRHQTIYELENEILGLTEYIRSLQTLFSEGGLDKYYVEGRARLAQYGTTVEERHLSQRSESLFDLLVRWVEDKDDFTPIAILGGYGAGKSSFAKRVVAHQAKKALVDPLARRPVLIKLGALASASSLEGLLGGMFTHDFPVDGFNTHTFLQMSDKGRLLMVLDGFDEMKHAMTWADFRTQITRLNRLTNERAKVVLLGRPSAFTSAEEHVHVLRGVRKFGEQWHRLPEWPEFREFELEPFTPTERSDFVRRYLEYQSAHQRTKREPGWISQRAAEVNRIADLDTQVFAKPVHAKILTDLASDPGVDLSKLSGGVSRWALYDLFFNRLAEREVEKDARRPIGEEHRLTFLRELAFWLWTGKGGATSFYAPDIPSSVIQLLPQGDGEDIEAVRREYLTGAFLEKKHGDIYYFGHRSFAEFLVAQRMLLRKPIGSTHSMYSDTLRDGVEIFLREAPNRHYFAQWADEVSGAQGHLSLDYFAFLAEMLGGVDALKRQLPSSSIWLPILSAFDDPISVNESSLGKLWRTTRDPNNRYFFLALGLLHECAVQLSVPHSERYCRTAAALIERVFKGAEVEANGGRARISAQLSDARQLAVNVLPALEARFGERRLVFRGDRLIAAHSEIKSSMGLDIGLSGLDTIPGWPKEDRLPWDAVLQYIEEDTRKKVSAYFSKAENMRGIVTVTTVPKRGG